MASQGYSQVLLVPKRQHVGLCRQGYSDSSGLAEEIDRVNIEEYKTAPRVGHVVRGSRTHQYADNVIQKAYHEKWKPARH